MSKFRILISSLALTILVTSCSNRSIQAPVNFTGPDQVNQGPASQYNFSPSILSVINAPDSEALIASVDDPDKQDIGVEYVKHFMFFTEIDQTGSAVEEILAHDGYANAAKYVTHWRPVLGENADWPDKFSTTHKGKKPAVEHGQMKNGTGWFWYRSAAQKTDEYFGRAVKAWKKGAAPDAPEQKEAWEWLARAAHFVQDTTLPFHAVTLARPGQFRHDPFEYSVVKNFHKYFPSKNYDGGAWNGTGPYPVGGNKWGNYFNERVPGQVIKNNADVVRGLYKIVNNKEDEKNGNWDKVQALVVPLASKTCAGLVVSFMQQVGEQP